MSELERENESVYDERLLNSTLAGCIQSLKWEGSLESRPLFKYNGNQISSTRNRGQRRDKNGARGKPCCFCGFGKGAQAR